MHVVNLTSVDSYKTAAVPPTYSHSGIIADSGATDTLFRVADLHHLHNVTQGGGLHVALPNGQIITSVATGELHLSDRIAPIEAHVFGNDDLNRTLIAVADICATGCNTTLTQNDITVSHNGEIVVHSMKAPTDKLWPITLPSQRATATQPHTANNVVTHQHNADYVAFVHASLCSPPVESLAKALRAGFLSNLPRLTPKMLTDNMPMSIATAKGHLNRNRQSQRHRVSVRPPHEAQQGGGPKIS